jgi:hypothetical protein
MEEIELEIALSSPFRLASSILKEKIQSIIIFLIIISNTIVKMHKYTNILIFILTALVQK